MLRRLQITVVGTILVYFAVSLVYIGTQSQSSRPRPDSLLLELPKPRLASPSILKKSHLVSLRSMGNNGYNDTENSGSVGVLDVHSTRHGARSGVDTKDNNPNLPPLASLIDSQGNVTGDVQFLLDFAIVGFGKCGTYRVACSVGRVVGHVLRLDDPSQYLAAHLSSFRSRTDFLIRRHINANVSSIFRCNGCTPIVAPIIGLTSFSSSIGTGWRNTRRSGASRRRSGSSCTGPSRTW